MPEGGEGKTSRSLPGYDASSGASASAQPSAADTFICAACRSIESREDINGIASDLYGEDVCSDCAWEIIEDNSQFGAGA